MPQPFEFLIEVAVFHPGQRSFDSGSGQESNSEGSELGEGAQLPARGRRTDPPGQIARSEGQSVQVSPVPYAHVVWFGGGGGAIPPMSAQFSGEAKEGSTQADAR